MGKNDGGPAFPMSFGEGPSQEGMTLRDWFAGQALAGLASLPTLTVKSLDDEPYSRVAYRLADAMLAERAKGGPQ